MKSHTLFRTLIVIGITALALVSLALAQSASARQSDAPTAITDSDSNPTHKPEVVMPDQYRPTVRDLANAAAASSTPVYFTPQDENTSTTVLFLYNTNATTSTVGLQTFYVNGSLTISTTIAVPPLGLVRICADSVSTVSASWANAILVNFTTFSAYARMTVPAGVKAEGFVAWNSTGIYDPLVVSQTLPLRFSTDPATVFLPALQNTAP
jgi:hypothetical protein